MRIAIVQVNSHAVNPKADRVSGGENSANIDSVVGIIEKRIKGCLLPNLDLKLSDSEPTMGSETASTTIATPKTRPTTMAESSRTCE